tara:strand:- start:465 stop:707 length:243 start_codon:yes stop_codon:yes gene_type:complete
VHENFKLFDRTRGESLNLALLLGKAILFKDLCSFSFQQSLKNRELGEKSAKTKQIMVDTSHNDPDLHACEHAHASARKRV